jgi:hypothetical protein
VDKFHSLEVGLWRTTAIQARHYMAAGYYFSNEIGLNAKRLVYGPKLGGFVSFGILGLGGELCYYTDFAEGSLRFIPYFGMCTHLFKLTINPHVVITNKEFNLINPGQISLTIQVATLRKKKMK